MTDLKRKLLDECLSAGVDENTKFFEALISILVQQREALERQSYPHIESFCKDRAKQALAATDEALKRIGVEV